MHPFAVDFDTTPATPPGVSSTSTISESIVAGCDRASAKDFGGKGTIFRLIAGHGGFTGTMR